MATDTTTELPCPSCGYDLRGQERSICPECGKPFDAAQLAAPKIPWERRKQLGRFRTFFRTASLATFRPSRLGGAGNAPVDYKSARRFQYVVVAVNYIPLLAALMLPLFISGLAGQNEIYSPWVSLPVCLLIFLLCATGVGSYFFHPRGLSPDRQNRGIALSYYACAPALLVPCGFAMLAVSVILAREMVNGWLVAVSGIATVILIVMGIFGPLITGNQLLRQATECSNRRCVAYVFIVLLLQLLLAGFCLIFLPASIVFVELFIQSLL